MARKQQAGEYVIAVKGLRLDFVEDVIGNSTDEAAVLCTCDTVRGAKHGTHEEMLDLMAKIKASRPDMEMCVVKGGAAEICM